MFMSCCGIDILAPAPDRDECFLSSVPPSPPVILSDSGRVLLDATDYVREGVIATLVCESMGGAPLPRLTW